MCGKEQYILQTSIFSLSRRNNCTPPRDPVQQVVEDVSTRQLAMELALRLLAGANAWETQMLLGFGKGRNDPPSIVKLSERFDFLVVGFKEKPYET